MSAASLDELRADREPGPARYRDEDFPGCESFHLPASELDHYEYRLEFWDGDTETAWKVCEPTSIQHEEPSRRSCRWQQRFESLRGSRIACYGSADLVRRDATGRKRWLMQADEVLYLHPDRVRLQGPAIEVDADPLPDVVLEVDHTTDVRRRKLGIYKESGFPEIWVLVPWEASVRRPGLAIHVRRGDVYREEPSSRAFPGWEGGGDSPRADRGADVGGGVACAGAHGAGDGSTRGHEAGGRSAHALASARGHGGNGAHGREMLASNVLAVLKARGIAVARDTAELRELLDALSGDAALAAALACTDEADFRRRVREQRDRRGRDGPGATHGGDGP